MTLYNNFWLKRGVGLFSGDYGIQLAYQIIVIYEVIYVCHSLAL